MARLDRTSGGSNTKKVTLTCLATPILSQLYLPSALNAGFAHGMLLVIFSDKKKNNNNNRSKRPNIFHHPWVGAMS